MFDSINTNNNPSSPDPPSHIPSFSQSASEAAVFPAWQESGIIHHTCPHPWSHRLQGLLYRIQCCSTVATAPSKKASSRFGGVLNMKGTMTTTMMMVLAYAATAAAGPEDFVGSRWVQARANNKHTYMKRRLPRPPRVRSCVLFTIYYIIIKKQQQTAASSYEWVAPPVRSRGISSKLIRLSLQAVCVIWY